MVYKMEGCYGLPARQEVEDEDGKASGRHTGLLTLFGGFAIAALVEQQATSIASEPAPAIHPDQYLNLMARCCNDLRLGTTAGDRAVYLHECKGSHRSARSHIITNNIIIFPSSSLGPCLLIVLTG